MPSEHDSWTHFMVVVNTAATVVGGFSGVAALIISIIALLRS